jgi:hypothetical protein
MRVRAFRVRGLISIACIAFVSLSPICWAGVLQSTDVSPDFPFGSTKINLAGRIPTVLIDPSNDSFLYAAAEWTGVWKSIDGGKSWQQASQGLRNGVTREFAYPNLAIDASNGQRLLYASDSKDGRPASPCEGCQFGGLWVSVDGAKSWQHVDLCSTVQKSDNVSSVEFSSGQPFVATDCGLWTTPDAKLASGTWTQLPSLTGIQVLAGSAYGGVLFACSGNRVYRSGNLGQTWDSGVDLGGPCTGLVAEPVTAQISPQNRSIAIRSAPNNKYEVSIVDHSSGTKQDLGFANVAISGSGRSGVWVTPGRGKAAVYYGIFAADTMFFYRYLGGQKWSALPSLHADPWWLAFPSTWNELAISCPAYAADDGGIHLNDAGHCAYDGWAGASHGLHVVWSQTLSGWYPLDGYYTEFDFGCALFHGGALCPTLFLPSTDDDTFMRTKIPHCAIPYFDPIGLGISGCMAWDWFVNYPWDNLNDDLGDSGRVLIDPAQPNYALAIRNQNYHMFVNPSGDPISWNTPGITGATEEGIKPWFDITPDNSYDGIKAPTEEGIKQVLTMPKEAPLKWGDFLGIVSTYSINANDCQTSGTCANDKIVRNILAAYQYQVLAQASWTDISPAEQFGPGQVAGIYPSGGHANLTLYVLTANDPNVYPPRLSKIRPGQLWKGQSSNQGPISNWSLAMGTAPNHLVRAYNVFVNPYDPTELYAVDLGGALATIKTSRDGGQTWTAVPELRDIATNNGEFNFACGRFAWGTHYADKEIFGNQCPMTGMVFLRDKPQFRFATLYPGGVAFSRDSGHSWMSLDVTNADPNQQPIELPQSAFYDWRPNMLGNSSLYVALEGKGVKRIDGPFATLQLLTVKFCPSCVPAPVGKPHDVSIHVNTLGIDVPLRPRPAPDGLYEGSILFDVAKLRTLDYFFIVNGRVVPGGRHTITDDALRHGVAVLTNASDGDRQPQMDLNQSTRDGPHR